MGFYSSYRLRARNAKGQTVHLWVEHDTGIIENLTVKEAYQIMEAHKSGFRFGEEDAKPIRNRIDHFELIHQNGHKEIITRADLTPKTSAPESARVTTEGEPCVCGKPAEVRVHNRHCPVILAVDAEIIADYNAADKRIRDAAQDALDAEQERTGIHGGCGMPMADHCAHCDVCPIPRERCDCGPTATIGATDGPVIVTMATPVPTVDDVARMTGDPVAWFDDLSGKPTPEVEAFFAGFRLKEDDVATMLTPVEAVILVAARARGWRHRNKPSKRRNRSRRA